MTAINQADLKSKEKCLISNTRTKKKFVCKDKFPCTLMACRNCKNIRKFYFLQNAIDFCLHYELNTTVGITWPLPPNSDPLQAWDILIAQFSLLNKKALGKQGKFIRVIALGRERGNPHVHYLINESRQGILLKVAKELHPGCITHSSKVRSLTRYLGYLFDQNFIPTHNHPGRPKRIRIISSSRGCRTGFPPLHFRKES